MAEADRTDHEVLSLILSDLYSGQQYLFCGPVWGWGHHSKTLAMGWAGLGWAEGTIRKGSPGVFWSDCEVGGECGEGDEPAGQQPGHLGGVA